MPGLSLRRLRDWMHAWLARPEPPDFSDALRNAIRELDEVASQPLSLSDRSPLSH